MTDLHTADLFGGVPDCDVVAPVSRLLVDVERFQDDAREPMAARGMGVLYSHTHDLKPLRRELSLEEREELLANYHSESRIPRRTETSGGDHPAARCRGYLRKVPAL